MVRINYTCSNCDFSFTDKDLIFYLDTDDENPRNTDDENQNNGTFNLEDILNEEIGNLKLSEESLNMENSDKMSRSLIAGFLYENYCPSCNELIRTYVPEENNLFSKEEIERLLSHEIHKESKQKNIELDSEEEKTNFKILFFDFKNSFYKDRRNILENNSCPNCKNEMSLVISDKIPCPKCGKELKEEF